MPSWWRQIVVPAFDSVLLRSMPLINVRTSLPEVADSAALLKELSAALAQQTGKPGGVCDDAAGHGCADDFAGKL